MLLLCLFGTSCSALDEKIHQPLKPLVLKNDVASLSIVPEIGGRVIEYKLKDRENIILADPATWQDSGNIPAPAGDAPWQPFFGHINWLSPQSDFWTQQTINPQRKSNWPPDPWLIYGNFKIIKKTDSSVTLQGPKSKVSGIQMTKTYNLKPDGKVKLTVEIKNIRQTPVSWGIWSNTRVPVSASAYTPINKDTKLRFDEFKTDQPLTHTNLRFKIINGFLSPKNQTVPKGYISQHGKVFLKDSSDYIAAFVGNSLFIKRMPVTPKEKLPPNHGFIELFSANKPGERPILELEMHGPYKTLKPGESTKITEIWELHPYDGPETSEAHIEFLQKNLH